MVKQTSYATITAGPNDNYSKFTVKGAKWISSDHDKGSVKVTFNVNSDVTVEKFWSDDKGLTLLYDQIAIGNTSFDGSIGEGTIYLETEKGIIIKGKIHGGPAERVTITGAGTWTQA